MPNIRHLLQRAHDGEDPDQLAAEFNAERRVEEAHDHLRQEIADDDDPTGQDNEERINRAARGLIDSRDELLKTRDPESYWEKRQMGLLG
jgi:hypothetical protein